LPDIEDQVWKRYRDAGVLVYGLHPQESPEALANFLAQTGVTFPVLADTGGSLSQFDFPPGVGYPYPRDIVIGKDLRVRSIRNSFNVDEMDALIRALLAE